MPNRSVTTHWAVSGLLNEQVGGPSVYPYQPAGLWLELNNRPGLSTTYEPSTGSSLYRRSLYTFWKRTVLSPMLKTLDAPSREFCTVRRSRTNTPLQALLLLQAPQFVEAARQLAQRIMTHEIISPDKVTAAEQVTTAEQVGMRVRFAFELVLTRQPSAEEEEILRRYYHTELERFRANPTAARKALSVGDSARNQASDPIEQAAWMAVARLLLNLDEAIHRG